MRVVQCLISMITTTRCQWYYSVNGFVLFHFLVVWKSISDGISIHVLARPPEDIESDSDEQRRNVECIEENYK